MKEQIIQKNDTDVSWNGVQRKMRFCENYYMYSHIQKFEELTSIG